MKIDRRSFLALSIGGAVGTALTPLPWKLQDDFAIWSQNWPWTPWPENGANSFVNTVSSLCSGGCGVSVRKVGERAVKVEGMPEHPTNRGGVCNLCAAGLQEVYGPSRVPSPLQRVGDRGQGQWAAISWDEALSQVAEKLGAIRQDGTPEALLCIADQKYGTMAALLQRFMTAYGSPNYLYPAGMAEAYSLTLRLMHGVEGDLAFDFENADYILSFGCGLIEGWGNTVRMIGVNSLWKDKKAVVKQIEPRLSNTAAKADQWIPITPGAEATLAMGIAYSIIKESLYDYDFVNNYAEGFDAFRDFVMTNYSPGNVAKQTGVDQSTIVALAREFSRARRPVAVCGRGQGHTPGAIAEYVAVHALNALVGNLNRPGGAWAVPAPEAPQWPAPETDAAAAAGLRRPRLDGAGTSHYPFVDSLLTRLPQALADQKPYPVKALMVYGANPLFTEADAGKMKEALANVPFIVSFATQMDETAAYADLVLPNHAHFERWEDVPMRAFFTKPLVGLSQPVVPPQRNTMHTGDFIIRLAQTLGGTVADALAWEGFEPCLQAALADRWSDLEDKGFYIDEGFKPAGWDQAFQTDSGKFRFASNRLRLNQIFETPRAEGDDSAYALTLIPFDSVRIPNQDVGSPPFLIKIVSDKVLKGNDSLVEINPETARLLGLAEGSRATLKTPVGSAPVRVHLTAGLAPGLLAMPRGLGHTAYDKFIAAKGVNVNDLIRPLEDPATGWDAAWGIRASLVKA